ncbi:MAG: hypothetical protein A2Y33_02440 [Spirochaetes bacterium GWF1_51_8]|nr:MAG: hypothetical protein A2Y33_02440 [Spirochaetes bacterium GWF1_51_8]
MSALLYDTSFKYETDPGCVLNPYITLKEALLETARIAKARELDIEAVEEVIREHAFLPVWLYSVEYLVNILLVNEALDKISEGNSAVNSREEKNL